MESYFLDLEKNEEYPFFTFTVDSYILECPWCGSTEFVSGKGETVKCAHCSFRADIGKEPEILREYGLILLEEGMDLAGQGEPKRALTRLRKSEKTFKGLLEENNRIDQEALFEVYERLAESYTALEDDRALPAGKKAIRILENLLEQEKKDTWLLLLSQAYETAAMISLKQRSLETFRFYEEKSLAALKEAYTLCSKENRSVMEYVLENTYRERAEVMETGTRGEDSELTSLFSTLSLQYYNPLLTLLKDLRKNHPDQKKELDQKIAETVRKIHALKAKIPEGFDAKEMLKNTGLSSKLKKSASNSSQKQKAKSQSGSSSLSKAREEPCAGMAEMVSSLARSYLDLAQEYFARKEDKRVLQTVEQCMNFLDSRSFWQERDDSDLERMLIYCENMLQCIDLLAFIDEKEKAAREYQALFGRIESRPEPGLLVFKADLAYKTAQYLTGANRKEEKQNWQKAMELCQKLVKETDSKLEKLVGLDRLYQIHVLLGSKDMEANLFKKGMHHYKKALSLAEEIIFLNPDEETIRLCFESAEKISQLYESRQVADQARKFQAKARSFENRLNQMQNAK